MGENQPKYMKKEGGFDEFKPFDDPALLGR